MRGGGGMWVAIAGPISRIVRVVTRRQSNPAPTDVADKGYDSHALREWLVARMVCRFTDWRRIASRFERSAHTFMSAISLAAAVSRRSGRQLAAPTGGAAFAQAGAAI